MPEVITRRESPGRTGMFCTRRSSLVTVLVLAIVFLTVVVYALALPEPLVEGLFRMAPARQAEKVERAMTLFSRGVEGWVLSNFIAGAIEGTLATVFLSWLGIPGALIWGVLAFFAEFVPKLGLYIMALPPTFVALGLDPMKAVWVVVFYMTILAARKPRVTGRRRPGPSAR